MRLLCVALLFLTACTPTEKSEDLSKPVAVGLDGRNFHEPQRSVEQQAKLDSNLAVAIKQVEVDPSEKNIVWHGRRVAYLSRYPEAVAIYTAGLAKFPQSFRLYRHRGHRYISMREFKRAVADLQQAAALMPRQPLEVELDGQPNKENIPLSTIQFNVWYHLGLAHYLSNDLESAEKAYLECMKVSNNEDLICATTDWLYMTYRRAGKEAEANALLQRIHEHMVILENESYFLRLRMYQGAQTPEALLEVNADNDDVDLALATQGYGVGNYYLCAGDTAKAIEVFKRVVEGNHFAAFGFIAAEADLARLLK